jgi:hypothetical protein
MLVSAHPASIRGAFRHRHERGKRDAMDALVSRGERRESGRRNRVVLIPRRWGQVLGDNPRATVAIKPGTPGRARISSKPLRREGRIASAEPVCSCALFDVHFARETAGAARTRSSLRPLFSEGHNRCITRAFRAAGMRRRAFTFAGPPSRRGLEDISHELGSRPISAIGLSEQAVSKTRRNAREPVRALTHIRPRSAGAL